VLCEPALRVLCDYTIATADCAIGLLQLLLHYCYSPLDEQWHYCHSYYYEQCYYITSSHTGSTTATIAITAATNTVLYCYITTATTITGAAQRLLPVQCVR
jgi:hypothetical protein